MTPPTPPLHGSLPPEGADPQRLQGFEGSYLGNREVLRPDSRLECKICWWVYDPAVGDPQWQIAAGTPFADLPSHWRCPNCDCEPDQFLLLP
jgi:rubredoxin